MKVLHVNFKNCYGIQSLEHDFQFGKQNQNSNSFAIYAPNGLMKTSFTKTFEKISQNESPLEERYNRPAFSEVLADGLPLNATEIYVLKSEIDLQTDSPAITDILVNPEKKALYDAIQVELDKLKTKLINSLQRISGVAKKDIEETVLKDMGADNFTDCIATLQASAITDELGKITYSTVFDAKAVDVLKSSEFVANAKKFNERYQDLFSQADTIYQRGVFNPARAETSFATLDKQGFFKSGHRVQMRGDIAPIDKTELDTRLKKIHAQINEDEPLKKIQANLAKNAQTQALADLIESLPPSDIDGLIERLKPANQAQLRRDLWAYYVQSNMDAANYIEEFNRTKSELNAIEIEAAIAAPRWTRAVELFNERFVDMPFTLSVANHTKAALGQEKAKLKFIFDDGNDHIECSRSEIKTLSQGEKRALYLLNFIFEVEARLMTNNKTLFIIDDVADSFDYKNKHAIVQYLEDLDCNQNFYQIILTHNFDFFRTLANNFIHRERCLMANRLPQGVCLTKADGINNYFVGILKEQVNSKPRAMCASIPFTRNLIEYINGTNDSDYLKLTSLLHWKKETTSISVNNYFEVYNRLFKTEYKGDTRLVVDVLFEEAVAICAAKERAGLNLEDKVLLSMSIRLNAERFLIEEIRKNLNDQNYWCDSENQFGKLIKIFSKASPDSPKLRILEKVSITVSSNIHLNSFMYEPILDLTIDHLVRLHDEVNSLFIDNQVSTRSATSAPSSL